MSQQQFCYHKLSIRQRGKTIPSFWMVIIKRNANNQKHRWEQHKLYCKGTNIWKLGFLNCTASTRWLKITINAGLYTSEFPILRYTILRSPPHRINMRNGAPIMCLCRGTQRHFQWRNLLSLSSLSLMLPSVSLSYIFELSRLHSFFWLKICVMVFELKLLSSNRYKIPVCQYIEVGIFCGTNKRTGGTI